MRNVLLLLLLPFATTAQHVQIKAGAGINIAKLDHKDLEITNVSAAAFSLKAGFIMKKWIAGVGVDVMNLKSKVLDKREGIWNPATGESTYPGINYTLYYGRPVLQPYVFINRIVGFRKHSLNFGLHAGVVLNVTKETYSPYYSPITDGRTKEYAKSFGYIAGAQAGYQYSITKRIGLFADVSPRFFSMQPNDKRYSKVSGAMMPVTAGILVNL